MILLIDNYDSFTFNLAQYLGELGAQLEVVRNDAITIEEIAKRRPERIVLSPGPCTPNEAGVCLETIREFAPSVPILGVCLGHQAIGQAFGGEVVRAKKIMHGKTSQVSHDETGLFTNVEQGVEVGRYHSLVLREETLPACLTVTARSIDDDEIMAISHNDFPTIGMQFHPESVLTPSGHLILENFLKGRR